MKRLAVYCGASARVDDKYLAAARAFGALCASREIGVVYGGCSTGLMGAVADGALAGGGEVIGVIPDVIAVKTGASATSSSGGTREIVHQGLTQLLRVPDMHTRKAVMVAYADAFVALPGGYGTLDELFEALTWRMIGTHNKPIGLLDVDGYWDHLIAFVAHANQEKLVSDDARSYLVVESAAPKLLDRLLA